MTQRYEESSRFPSTGVNTRTRPKSVRVAIAVALLTGVILCLLPLFGVIGVESALVVSIVLSPLAAALGAHRWVHSKALGKPRLFTGLWEGACLGLVLLSIPLSLLAFNALRVRWCEPLEALAFFAFGPGISLPIAGMMGCAWASLMRPGRWAIATAALLPLLEIAAVLAQMWHQPGIFAYGHFFGYFPGTLYDLGLQFLPAYLAFRATTLWMLLGTVLIATGHASQWPRPYAWRQSACVAVGLGCLLLLSLVNTQAPKLGFATSRGWIIEQLGRTLQGQHCKLHLPRETDRDEARRLLEECDFRVAQIAHSLGLAPRQRPVVYFFRSAEEKRALVGASETMIAKPWLSEAYLQMMPWPHPVLAHELAHVVAADVGRGPFRISGRLAGLWPEPAIIEGTAVALAWDAKDELTPHQWAKALLAIGKVPSVDDVFGASFLRQAPNQAYTVAGSFIRYVLAQHGPAALRRLYATADISQATGRTPRELTADWRAYVSQQELPRAAIELARDRFARPGIFSQTCPHKLAELRADLSQNVQAGDAYLAGQTCRAMLELDRYEHAARTALLWVNAADGKFAHAEKQLAALQGDRSVPQPVVARGEELLGDAYWRTKQTFEAQAFYRRALARPLSLEVRRLLQVKLLGTQTQGPEAEHFRNLFASEKSASLTPVEIIHRARELASARQDGLAAYLEARQLWHAQAFEVAMRMLKTALARGLPNALLTEEANRLLGMALVATGQVVQAEHHWSDRVTSAKTAANRVEAADWLQRVRYMRTKRITN